MNIGVFSPMPSAVADPAVVAKRAEELGFESYWVPDHPILPVGAEKEYPGASSDSDESAVAFLSRIPDPLIVLARAGAVTRNIKLGTGVYLVPERHPIISAQQIATLDEACQGRFLFGIGAGWNKTECELLGCDFPHRWGQTKDSIAAMAAFEEGMKKLTSACEGVGRDMATVDVTIFGMSGQWRCSGQTRQLKKGGANRVIIWTKARDSRGAIQEMEALATELL